MFGGGIDIDGDGRNSVAEIAWFVLRMLALLFATLTTGAFFYKYAGDAFSFLFGDYSPHFTAVVGAISLDVFSQVWSYLSHNHADTERQILYSKTMGWLDISASVVVSSIFMLLNTAFQIGITTADGTLTTIGTTLNLVGAIIIVLAISGNFMGAHLYLNSSSSVQRANNAAKMRAYRAAGQFKIDQTREYATVSKTISNIQRQLPLLTEEAAGQEAEEYIGRTFRHLPQHSTAQERSNSSVRNDRGMPVNSGTYDIAFTQGGQLHRLNERMELEEAWHKRDNFHDDYTDDIPDALFVVTYDSMQPVDRRGLPIHVEMISEDDDVVPEMRTNNHPS